MTTAESIFVEYVHEQTKLQLPVDASAAASLIVSKGVPFQKTKENKDLLLSLFNTYKELYALLRHIDLSQLNLEYVSSLPIVSPAFLPILPDLIYIIKQDRTISLSPLPAPLPTPLPTVVPANTTGSFDVLGSTGSTGAAELPPPIKLPRDGIDRTTSVLTEEDSESVLEEQLQAPEFSPIAESKTASQVIPELDAIQLSFGIDLIVAQYRDMARDIRYLLLTQVDLYKDTVTTGYYTRQIELAIEKLRQGLQDSEQSKGFVDSQAYRSQNTIVPEHDHPTQAYELLLDYYDMIKNLLRGMIGEKIDPKYTSVLSHLQHHLALLRTKSPQEVQEYKQVIRLTKPIPAQRVLYISKAINSERKGLLKSQTSSISELVYYALLASIDNNPACIIDDPTLDNLFSTIYIPPDSEFRNILHLSPEQRFQFIQFIASKQPFEHLLRVYQHKPLVSVIPLLKQFILDNQPRPQEQNCEGLAQFFSQELQSIQSDLKRYIVQYGENVRASIVALLEERYKCSLNETQLTELQAVIDKGIDGQLFLLNQLFQHYPPLVDDETYQHLLEGLSKQYTYLQQSHTTLDSSNEHPFQVPGLVMKLEEAKISPLQFLHEFIEDEQLPVEKQDIKQRLIRLRDYFNHAENRTKVYHVIDLMKKRHQDISNRDKSTSYKQTIVESLPDEEDPLRIFLLNFLDLYGTLDKIPIAQNHQVLQLSRLRHLPISEQKEAVKQASMFLLRSGIDLESSSHVSAKDKMILNQIEFTLYSPQASSAISFLEERVNALTFPSSLREYKEEVEKMKQDMVHSLRAKDFEKTKSFLRTFQHLLRAKVMKDPFYSSGHFREQRLQKRTLAERIASRLPASSPLQKELMLWYLLKPWMTSMSHTEYRNFEYFIALPTNAAKDAIPKEVASFFGTRLSSRDLGFVRDVCVYRPTMTWWNYIVSRYHTVSGKCKNRDQMIDELTIEGHTKQRFVIGMFAPGFAARVFTSADLRRECKWFDDHFTPSQTQFAEWLHTPAAQRRSTIQPYLQQLILRIFEKGANESGTQAKQRYTIKAKSFVDTLFEKPHTIGEILTRFFTVYTFLNPNSIVFGYARILLDAFGKSAPAWYPYLLNYTIAELFPELTLVDPDVKEQIKRLIKEYVQQQIKEMFSQAHPSVLPSDLQLQQQERTQQLTHLLENEVRPYVQTKWCPIDKSIVWFLAKDGEEMVQCASQTDLESTPYIPTNVVQAIKAQLASSDLVGKMKEEEVDLTIDTDIEMTAIRHFTEILRDTTVRSGEYSASRLAREISKSHPNPVSGKQLPVEPIRQKLQSIAEAHFVTLEKKLINQYVNCHPELFVQFQSEKESRYRKYALVGSKLEVAEHDFTGRKRILAPLLDLIRSSFGLQQIDEDRVVQLVTQKLNDVELRHRLVNDQEEELPQLCGMCHAPTTAERQTFFYINGVAEPEFFCSLDCADKRMLKFQQEPRQAEVEMDADHDLFHMLLKYYPSRGIQEPGEHGLYIPNEDILLQHEEGMRQLATTINEDLPLEFDLVKLYRGIVGRYRKAYEDILQDKEKHQKKFSVEVLDGCDITMKQLRDFFVQQASRYYDQLVDGSFSFINGLMNDFYQTYPVCDKLPEDILQTVKQYHILKRLSSDIERAYRLSTTLSSEEEIIKNIQTRLEQIYKWRYLRDAKKMYPYLSEEDHLVKATEQFKAHPVQQDIDLCLQFINRHAPIGERIKTSIDFLREVHKQGEKASGQNRLMRLLEVHKVDLSVSLKRHERALGLMIQMGSLFPDELRKQLQEQQVVIRRAVKMVSKAGGEVKLKESLYESPLVGISRKRNRQMVVEDFGKVKEEHLHARTKEEMELIEQQLITLKRQIQYEIDSIGES